MGSWRSQLLGNSAKPTFHTQIHHFRSAAGQCIARFAARSSTKHPHSPHTPAPSCPHSRHNSSRRRYSSSATRFSGGRASTMSATRAYSAANPLSLSRHFLQNGRAALVSAALIPLIPQKCVSRPPSMGAARLSARRFPVWLRAALSSAFRGSRNR